MPVSAFTAGFIADAFIAANDLQPTCKTDIVLLAKQLGEDDEANKLLLDGWLETRDHVRKSPQAKADEWDQKTVVTFSGFHTSSPATR